MHVTMNVLLLVEEIKALNYLTKHVEHLIRAEVLLAEGLPLRNWIRSLHLDEN